MEDRFPSNTPLKVPLYSDNKNSCAAVKFVSSLGFTLEILVFISRLTSQASGKQFYTFLRKSHKKTPIKEDASQSVSSLCKEIACLLGTTFTSGLIQIWCFSEYLEQQDGACEIKLQHLKLQYV